jgi:hypothetical protein
VTESVNVCRLAIESRTWLIEPDFVNVWQHCLSTAVRGHGGGYYSFNFCRYWWEKYLFLVMN